MFQVMVLKDTVRIPPANFGKPLEEAALAELKSKYEGLVNDEVGYVIMVTEVNVDQMGHIIPGDGATYHSATFSILTFYPEMQEVLEGEVVEIADFGGFLRIGPVDSLLHVSQLLDDFISYDEKQGVLMGKETGRTLKRGDVMRVRIVAVSFPAGRSTGKTGVTARQPFLGKLEWIQEDLKKARSNA